MPQSFQVLKCYKCSIFQVHLAKKSNKWECKLCGEKQSIKRHYGIGTALECRGQVQKLNAMQGDKYEKVITVEESDGDSDHFEYIQKEIKLCNLKRKSKWSAFIDDNDNSDVDQLKDNNLDNCVKVSKKQKYELCRRKSNDEHVGTNNNFNKFKEKKHEIQESKMNANNWSAFVCDDDSPINRNEKFPVQVPKTQCELYGRMSNVYENATSISFRHNKSNEKKYPMNDQSKSNKWSAYMSDDENVKEECKASQRDIDDNKLEMTYEIRDLPNDLKTSKNSVTENSELKPSLFSLCDDNDLDSILYF